MWPSMFRTLCCLLLLCTTCSKSSVNCVSFPLKKHRDHHPTVFETINEQDVVYNEYSPVGDSHVKGRSSVPNSLNIFQTDDLFESLHRSDNERTHRGAPPPPASDSKKMEEFMESFYLKQLRIEMQKSLILQSFPLEELPEVLVAARNGSALSSDEMDIKRHSQAGDRNEVDEEYEDEDQEDQEMRNFVRKVGSSIEQNDIELPDNSEVDADQDNSSGWLANIRPIYQFIQHHMKPFVKEWIEHRRKMEQVWKHMNEERNALERENHGDEPYDLQDFEEETEKREIIFLDELDCDHVFKGYYPQTSAKKYLDFCLQIDRNKFKSMIGSPDNHSETNSISELPQLQIHKAELWFYKSNADAMDSHNQMFSLTSIDNWDTEGKYKKFKTISLKQSPTTVGWISADVSAPMVDWLSPVAFATLHKNKHRDKNTAYHRKRNSDAYYAWKRNYAHTPKHKFFLNVSCKTCLGGGPTGTVSENKSHRPFFLIDYKRIDRSTHGASRTKNGGESRNRRSRRNLNCSSTTDDCCRERVFIEFNQVGMEFIISPRGYYANYCRGSCTTAAANALRSTHNTVLNNYAKVNPKGARQLGLKTCCSATDYESLTVMYTNPKTQEIHNRTMNNLIVKSCGCN